MNPTLNLKD